MELLGFVFATLFGSGSWVALRGIYSVSQPLWTRTPECYTLSSILFVAIQLGNIGALVYVLVDRCLCVRPEKRRKVQEITIWFIYGIGTVSCFLLAFLWNKTNGVLGEDHSVALIILTWCLALVDCSSSVTFLPYMGQFSPELISALFVGEGLSGVIPAVLGLIQTQNTPSANQTSFYCPHNQPPQILRFSVGVYFALLSLLMLLSFVGFLGLRRHYRGMNALKNTENKCQVGEASALIQVSHNARETSPTMRSVYGIYLLLMMSWISCLAYGLLPPISPYAFQPYGNSWSAAIVNSGILSTPITALIAYWLPWNRILGQRGPIMLVNVFVVIITVLAGFIVWVASPMCDRDRPLYGKPGGAFPLLLANVALYSGVTFVSIVLAREVEKRWGEKGLLYYGLVSQIGSLIGTLSIFGPVQLKLFKQPSKSKCN